MLAFRKIVNGVVILVLLLSLTCASSSSLAERLVEQAREDAIYQLKQQVKDLTLSSGVKIAKLFQSAEQRQRFDLLFPRYVHKISDPVVQTTSCEITLAITIVEIVQLLEEIGLPTPQTASQRILYATGRAEKATLQPENKQTPQQVEQEREIESRKWKVISKKLELHTPSSSSASDFWQRVTPQGKLLAIRAAKADAYRNVMETIQGIELSSQTKVENFVTQNDQIRTALNKFLQGIEVEHPIEFRADGIVEVTVKISRQKLQQALARMDIPTTNSSLAHNEELSAKGTGVPPANTIQDSATGHSHHQTTWQEKTLVATLQVALKHTTSLTEVRSELQSILEEMIFNKLHSLPTPQGELAEVLTKNRQLKKPVMQRIGQATKESSSQEANNTATIVVKLPLQEIWQTVSPKLRKNQ